MSNGIELLISDTHGIYIPQRWAMYCQDMDGVRPENMEILKKGPDHPWYWEAWDEVLGLAHSIIDGKKWYLWQDGDLFAVCDELMTDEEYENFFGEERHEPFDLDTDSRLETDNLCDQ
jgi:hypothetical protein